MCAEGQGYREAMLATREGDRIRCGLCPRACLIGEGGTGACGARGVVGGSLRALTYGLVSSAADDPIEKKPVFHYRPGSRVLSVGGVGCSLRCGHCQNWRISRPHGVDGSVSLEYLPPDKLVSLALERACEGVAWTYNEPIIWLEYVLDGARIASQQGLFSVMVTNGYVTTAGLDLLAEHVDVWRTDLKAYSEDVFRRLCHADDSAAVRTAAVRAKRVHGLHVECVTNVVPTINDSDEELRRIADFIVRELSPSTPWHVTRFVPHLDFSELDPTPLETLERARTIGMEEGLEFVYLGNVDVPGGEDTRCPGCHVLCVSRRGFSADPVGLDAAGHCSGCGRNLGIVR